MIVITQLIYVKSGKEQTFHEFEDVAIPIIAKYGGKLLLRIRPRESEVIEHNIPAPYEIHLVEFTSATDFEKYMNDDARRKFLHLKTESIESAILFKGSKIS